MLASSLRKVAALLVVLTATLHQARASDDYKMVLNTFIVGYVPQDQRTTFDTLAASQTACSNEPTCGGVTREPVRSFQAKRFARNCLLRAPGHLQRRVS